METVVLEVKSREAQDNAKDLRNDGMIPIEYYGRGVENRSLKVPYQAFRRVYKVAGASTIIELKIDDKDTANVLVHEVDFDPVTDDIIHVDLVNVRMTEELHTSIPLEFVGMALAVKDLSGTLTTHLTELEVKCLPKDLVHSIQVSLEPLVDFHTFIRVKDLQVPANIHVLNGPEDVVVNVAAPRVEEEPAPAEEALAEGTDGAVAEGTADAKPEESAEKSE